MIERVAIAAAPLRLVVAALVLFVVASAGLLSSALTYETPTRSQEAASSIRCTHGANRIRTRTSGLHPRFLTRDLVPRRTLQQLDR